MHRPHYACVTQDNLVIAVFCTTLQHITDNPARYPLPEGCRWVECKEGKNRPLVHWVYDEASDDFYLPPTEESKKIMERGLI